MAPWARAEENRRIWAGWRAEFFGHVRLTFIVLFGVAIYVYVSNHQLQIELATSQNIHRVLNHTKLDDELKAKALNYQSTVDSINSAQ